MTATPAPASQRRAVVCAITALRRPTAQRITTYTASGTAIVDSTTPAISSGVATRASIAATADRCRESQ